MHTKYENRVLAFCWNIHRIIHDQASYVNPSIHDFYSLTYPKMKESLALINMLNIINKLHFQSFIAMQKSLHFLTLFV